MKPWRSLFSRFLFGTIIAVVLALVVVALSLPRMAEGLLLAAKQRDLLGRGAEAEAVASAYLSGNLPELQAKTYLAALGAADDMEAWIVDRQGTIVLDSSREGAPALAPGAAGGFGRGMRLRGHHLPGPDAAVVLGGRPLSATGTRWPYSDPVVSVGVPVRTPGGTGVLGALFLNSPVSGVAQTAAELRKDLLLAAGVGLIAALGAAVALSRNVTGPIREMCGMACRIAEGDLDVRAPVGGPGEIGELGRSLNIMAAGLAASREEGLRMETLRRDLVANVSHDLRSPITAIRGYIEPLLDGTVTDEATRRRYLKTARTEAEALGALVTDLLELNRLDAGASSLKLSPVDLGQLAREAAARFALRSEETGVTLRAETAAEGLGPVLADEGRVARAIANLLDNGFKFTPRGGEIRLAVDRAPGPAPGSTGPGEVVISVRDTGPGVAPSDLPLVWERFYKADRSRHRRTPGGSSEGSGLGLAIVKEVAEAHGGRVEVESEPGQGAEFRVYLPLRPPPRKT